MTPESTVKMVAIIGQYVIGMAVAALFGVVVGGWTVVFGVIEVQESLNNG